MILCQGLRHIKGGRVNHTPEEYRKGTNIQIVKIIYKYKTFLATLSKRASIDC